MKFIAIIKKVLFIEGSTPLPVGISLLMFTIVLFNALTVTSVFSYLPRLIKEFGISEVDVGKKAGIMASSMFIARIFSSLMWGYICDKCGKKLSLLMSGGSTVISTMMFAFSFNYDWAVATRFIQGSCMGISVVTKAYMTDICDDSNLPTGLGLIFGAYNIGVVIGPSMAGFLVFPVEKYPGTFKKDSFFDTYKIFIPNFIFGFGLTLELLISVFLLPKRNSNIAPLVIKDNKDTTINSKYNNGPINDSINIELLKHEKSESLSETSPLIVLKPSTFKRFWIIFKSCNFVKLLRSKQFILAATLYGMYGLFLSGYEEMFPVFASTSIEYGGLGMTTSDIGIIYLIVSVSMLVLQMVLINRIIHRIGSKKIFFWSSILSGVLIPIIPLFSNIKKKVILWAIVWINQLLVRAGLMAGYTAVNILINNSVGSELLGTANGFGLSIAYIGRSIGTSCFGSIYTWSLKEERSFPFNKYFTFFMILIVIIAVSLFSLCVPESLNKKKIVREQK